jgi:hypothetical protein
MYNPFIMPFGKYQGKHFDEIPPSYFDWLLDQEWLSDRLRKEIEDYLNPDTWSYANSYANSSKQSSHTNSSNQSGHSSYNTYSQNPIKPTLTADETIDFQKILKLGIKALVLKYHPDTGGTNEDMKRLNNLIEKLRNITGLL